MRTKHMSICRIPALLILELYQMIRRMRNSAPADATYFLPSQIEHESGLISQNIWQHSLVWMARILNDILFVIILFIHFIYCFIYLFIIYFNQLWL